MKLYFVSDTFSAGVYAPTLGAAHGAALGADFRTAYVRIHETHVSTDRANLLRILNGEGGFEEPTGREWTLAANGALQQVRPNPGIERWKEAQA